MITFLQIIVFAGKLSGQSAPAVIPGDFADPSIIRVGKTYYAVGTSSEWAPHFPIFKSSDLVSWAPNGYVFTKKPEWTASSFWAPEYYFYNNTYFIYYTAKRKKDGVSCIGVATSRYPDKGFRDRGVIVDFGKEAIDGFVFNDNGQLYITWKAYGLDNRPIEILGSKLSADGLSLTGETFSMMKDDERIGMEGQSILKKDGYYYLFYSAGNCCGIKCDYNVRVARSNSLQGPYEVYGSNPILQKNAVWKCPGHGTFVTTPDNRYYYLHHAYNVNSNVFTGRQGLLHELVWSGVDGWPAFREDSAALKTPLTTTLKDMDDNFSEKYISPLWQWDFRNTEPVISLRNGLHLSGTTRSDDYSGTAITVRPFSAQYDISTAVMNHNNALKGLVIYGDANAAAGVGTIDNRVEFWAVKDNKKTVLASAQIDNIAKPVQLKMSLTDSATCKAFWKQSGDWKKLGNSGQAYQVNFLPPWDRSPRPGVIFKGSADKEAVFSFFKLSYAPAPMQ